LPKSARPFKVFLVATRLNISLSGDQAAWLKSRKQARREREKGVPAVEAAFDRMDKRDGADGDPPIQRIVQTVRKIRKELLCNRID
jgi:hypothetical protein